MSAAALLGAQSPVSLQGGNAGPSEATGQSTSDGLAATNITLGGSFAVGGGSKAKTGDVGGGQEATRQTPQTISGLPEVTNFATPILIGVASLGLLLIAWKMQSK